MKKHRCTLVFKKRVDVLSEEREKMVTAMEEGGHPILEHMDEVVGKLRQVLLFLMSKQEWFGKERDGFIFREAERT